MKILVYSIIAVFLWGIFSCSDPTSCETVFFANENQVLELQVGEEYSAYYNHVFVTDSFSLIRIINRDTLITIDTINDVAISDTTITIDTIDGGAFLSLLHYEVDLTDTTDIPDTEQDTTIIPPTGSYTLNSNGTLELGSDKFNENFNKIEIEFLGLNDDGNRALLRVSKFDFMKDCSNW